MIAVTKLNRSEILLNSDLIEMVEETPDTVILLTNGHGIRVRETMAQVLHKVTAFRRTIGGQTNPNMNPPVLRQEYNFDGRTTEDTQG